MESVIFNAQAKCREAITLMKTITNRHNQGLLEVAIDNVYKSIGEKNISKLLERTKALNNLYKAVMNKEV